MKSFPNLVNLASEAHQKHIQKSSLKASLESCAIVLRQEKHSEYANCITSQEGFEKSDSPSILNSKQELLTCLGFHFKLSCTHRNPYQLL